MQEVDIISMVSAITKYAVTVNDPERIRYHLERACYLAKTGRPGPVWIDIPLDVQERTLLKEKFLALLEKETIRDLTEAVKAAER